MILKRVCPQKSTSMEESSARDKRTLKEEVRELASLKTSTWSSRTSRAERGARGPETSPKPVTRAAPGEGDKEDKEEGKEGACESLLLSTWSEKETEAEKEEPSKLFTP